MELPMKVIVAVVVAAIVLLIIAVFAGWVKGFGAEALENLWNVGSYIDCLIKKAQDPDYQC